MNLRHPDTSHYAEFLLALPERLWDKRGLAATAGEHVHPQAVIRSAEGIGYGPQAVVADARAGLLAFPDLARLGEDVIADGSAARGHLGALRLLSTGTHRGPGPYGPPQGRAVAFREMVFCHAKGAQISDLWRVRDSGALLRALGCDPLDWARAQLDGLDPDSQPFHPAIDVTGPYTGQGNANHWGMAYADLLGQIMKGEHGAIARQYDRACHLEHPGGHSAHGWQGADAFWLGLRAAFPSAEFTWRHRLGIEEPLMPPRAALHWSLQGSHDGWGAFGAPSGAEVFVMGMSMAEFGPRGLRREWVLYDMAAIWTQIAAARG